MSSTFFLGVTSFKFFHGWSLSEHGEWSKFSNYKVSLNVPFILRVPGLTANNKKLPRSEEKGYISNDLVELVDLFPTLVDAAGLHSLPRCPVDSQFVRRCTEGTSLISAIDHVITGQQVCYSRG